MLDLLKWRRDLLPMRGCQFGGDSSSSSANTTENRYSTTNYATNTDSHNVSDSGNSSWSNLQQWLSQTSNTSNDSHAITDSGNTNESNSRNVSDSGNWSSVQQWLSQTFATSNDSHALSDSGNLFQATSDSHPIANSGNSSTVLNYTGTDGGAGRIAEMTAQMMTGLGADQMASVRSLAELGADVTGQVESMVGSTNLASIRATEHMMDLTGEMIDRLAQGSQVTAAAIQSAARSADDAAGSGQATIKAAWIAGALAIGAALFARG